jgi:hypothetical protein
MPGIWGTSSVDNSGDSQSNLRYDDMLGDIRTAPTGAAQWLTAQIGSTGFFINWLQSGQNDFAQQSFQMTHRKSLSAVIKSFHIHYLLSSVPVAGNTIKIEYAYTWINPNDQVPLIGNWTSGTKTITFTGAEVALTNYYIAIVENIASPANEAYSSLLLIKLLRRSQGGGADSYGGNFGLLYTDLHIPCNRLGSLNESSD